MALSFSVVPDALKPTQDGARHGDEIPYVFGTLETVRVPTGAVDQTASHQVSAYWSAFAREGVPAPDGLPIWPDANADMQMDFTERGPNPETDPRAHELQALSIIVDPKC